MKNRKAKPFPSETAILIAIRALTASAASASVKYWSVGGVYPYAAGDGVAWTTHEAPITVSKMPGIPYDPFGNTVGASQILISQQSVFFTYAPTPSKANAVSVMRKLVLTDRPFHKNTK